MNPISALRMPKWVAFPAIAMVAAGVLTLPGAAHAQDLVQEEADLPPGPEKALVEAHCTQCHSTGRIAKSGGTVAGWSERMARMIRKGSTLPRADIPALARYLAKAYPERMAPVRPAVGHPVSLPAQTDPARRLERHRPR